MAGFWRSKTAIPTILPAMNFEFLEIFDIKKCETFPKIKNQSLIMVKMEVFDILKSAKIDFT